MSDKDIDGEIIEAFTKPPSAEGITVEKLRAVRDAMERSDAANGDRFYWHNGYMFRVTKDKIQIKVENAVGVTHYDDIDSETAKLLPECMQDYVKEYLNAEQTTA